MPTVNYVWDELDDNILAEYDDAGNVTAEYTHEPGPHGQLVSQYHNGQTYFHHFDGEGNTRDVTDQNGNVVETATYSAFGEVVQKTSSIVNPFGFRGALGYYVNPQTNDIDVSGRIYRPQNGRWLSVDSTTFAYAMKLLQPAIPPGSAPGTFNVLMGACSAYVKETHPGCCCSDIAVVYKPSAADMAACARICLKVVARQNIERHMCPDFDWDWHSDAPKDKQTCWSSPRLPGDSPTNASWTDFPGGGPSGGTDPQWAINCPPICAWTKLKQDWEVCAICSNAGISRVIGCVQYGHVCKIKYTRVGIAGCGFCDSECTMTRTGRGQDLPPSNPEHLGPRDI